MKSQIEVAGVVIEEADLDAMSEQDIVEMNRFGNILRAETNPEDPPRPLEITRAHLRNIPPFIAVRMFLGRDPDGSIVADAEASVARTDDNQHLMWAGISIRPDRRGRGIAKAMLPLIVEAAEAEQRTLLQISTIDAVPAGAEFAKKIGAEPGLEQHVNRLMLADVDRDLVRRWVEEGPARAADFDLLAMDGPYPEEHLEEIARVSDVMNTAPRDDLDMEDWKTTPEQLRHWDKMMVETGSQRWSLFAVHRPTGQFVGFTEVSWNPAMPKVVHQMGTAVDPAHRGHALGKWMKAAMIERVLNEREAVVEIRTGNADSNDAMLGINTQLGFKPWRAAVTWQVPVEKVRAYLGSSV